MLRRALRALVISTSVFVLFVSLFAGSMQAATRIVRVKSGANSAGANGTSWATAFPSLTSALQHAVSLHPSSSDPVEIWIAAGTYKPAAPEPDPENHIFETDPRDGTFAIPSFVSLYGGFAGIETQLGQRVFSDDAAMTVLSGDIGSTYLANEAAPTTRAQALLATVRDPENANFADNVTNVITIIDGTGITLDRLLITAGYAKNLATVPLDYVQEMAMSDAANAANGGSKRAITREAAGGGAFIQSATLPGGTAVTFTDCIFVQNHAFGFGGGVAIIRSRVTSRSTLYIANSAADSGGAVFGRGQFSSFEGDVMVRNLSQGNGGAVHLNTPPVAPSNWANSDARFLFGSNPQFALDTISGQVDLAAMMPGIAAPRAGLLSLQGAAALTTKVAIGKGAGEAMNYVGISTGYLKYVTLALDVTDLIVNELRVQGVDGKFIDYWVGEFMPTFQTFATPQGMYAFYEHTFVADAKFDRKTPEWQVKKAYDIFFNPAQPTRFSDVRFDHNTAYGDGGAIFALHANYVANRTLFTENFSESSGGAIAARAFNDSQIVNSVFSANASAGYSAISLAQSARLRLLNSTVVNNISTSPAAAVGCELGSELRVLNTVLWGNTSSAFPLGGADIYTATPANLDESTRKVYDAAPAHRFTFVGITDIVGSDVQGLASLTNSWGVPDIHYLSGSNLSPGEIAVAQRLRDLADFSSTTDLFKLTVMGVGNRYLYDRGNMSVDPQLHDGWLPGINSPLINNGRRDAFGLGLSPSASQELDFLGLARTQDYTTISIGAVQSPATSSGGSAEAVGRYFVTPTGAGDKSGRNWANASDNLKAMLAQSNAEIWVAAGTYKPDTGNDRFAAFTLGENTRAYGGFAGTETVFVDRDVAANVTLLSGQLNGVQSYHVVKQVNTDGSILLDGFTITAGKADGSSEDATGGGAYLFNTSAILRNVTFNANTATVSGGAVHIAGDAEVGIYDSTFTHNSSASGGAVHAVSPLLIERCRFDSNTASDQGGAIAVDTNGDSEQRADFHNSLFSRNRVTATGAGSALYVNVMLNQIVNCTFTKNEGRVYSADDPTAGQFGSAVYYHEAAAIIINSLFWKNASDDFLASGTPLELASFYVSREESFGLSLVHSNVEALSRTHPLTGAERAQGSFASQLTRVGNIYIRTGSTSNSFIDTCYDYDPKFVDFANNDFRLSANSDIVDHGKSDAAGIGTLDLAGRPRKVNNTPDVGAYEFQGTTNSVFSVVSQARQITPDGPVYTLTFHPENPLSGDATYTWMVNKNDGRGFVTLPTDARITGQGTAALTLNQPPSSWNNWVFRVSVGGTNTASASVTLTARGSDRFYVNAVVSASGDGRSWATAFKTITEATLAARAATNLRPDGSPGTDYSQIWVAQGTYRPEPYYSKEAIIYLYEGMVLYGGFKGYETSQRQRNPALYPTILTGAQPDATESYHFAENTVLTGPFSESALPVVIDGFTIRTAKREALLVAGETQIVNCIIENEMGTGARIQSPASFKQVTFRLAANRGVYVSAATVSFENSLFYQNTGPEGAALYNYQGNVTITTSTIADNFSTERTGGIAQSFYGGTLTIDRSIFWNNRDNATELGAALEPAQLQSSAGTLTVTNSLIEALTAFTTGGNLGFHPLFNDPINGNYTLDPKSPAIALGAGALPYVGTPGPELRFTSIPASSEEMVSLFDKSYTITWAADASHALSWQINLGNGWVSPASTALTTSSGSNATSATLNLGSASILPSLRVRAVNASGHALPPITLKVVPPVVRYVNASATGTANGLSWNTAWRTLADAYANLPGPNVELWVARGTYPIAGRVRAQPGVTLFGGFAGTETSLSQRVLGDANKSVLQGAFAIQTGDFYYGPTNQKHPARSVGRQLVLDGFTLERGENAAYSVLQATGGGGILRNCEFKGAYNLVSLRNVSTVFEHCTFANATESAIVVTNASPTFRNCLFADNVSPFGGGALKASQSNVLIDRSIFRNNTASYNNGGAIHALGGALRIANSVFTGNTATNGGALYGQNLTVVNCTLAHNRAVREAGGLYVDSNATVFNSILWGNTAAPTLTGDSLAVQKAQLTQISGSIALNNSIVEGLVSNLGTGNQPYDPLFTSGALNPYGLAARSPALGRGVAADLEAISPLAGFPGRLQGSGLDLGAFESSENDTLAPIQLARAPASTTVFSGATASFVISGANLGANVAWERLVGGNWVLVSGAGFSLTTTGSTSTLTVANATATHTGNYRYRIASLGYVSPSFTFTVTPRRIVYVDAAAPAGGTGSSWGSALNSLAAANNLPDAALEIRIAAGTYANPNLTLKPARYFRGGYPATGSAAQREVSNPTANPVIVTGNSVATGDGTTLVFDASTGFEGITFRTGNVAQQYQRGVVVFFRQCRFENTPGGVGGFAGAVMFDVSSSGLFEDCTFTNNDGPVISTRYLSSARIIRGTFTANRGTLVSAARDGAFTIEDSVFTQNAVRDQFYLLHTGIDNFDSSLPSTITRSRFTDNAGNGTLINSAGGPLFITDSLVAANAIQFLRMTVATTFRHLTVVDNIVPPIASGDRTGETRRLVEQHNGELAVANSIFWGNRSTNARDSVELQQLKRSGGTLTFDHNLIEDFATLGGTGNSASNPLFTDASTGDYTLTAYSPAVATGSAATSSPLDLLLAERAGTPDLGAYDFRGTAQSALQLTSIPLSTQTYVRRTAEFTVTGTAGTNITWLRWNGTAYEVIDPANPGNARLSITATASGSTLSLANVSLSDTGGYAWRIGGYTSARLSITPTVRPRVYVDAASPAANGTGSSWATAVRSFEWAYKYAPDSAEIWVKRGSYSGGGTLRADIEVYGGFESDATDIADRGSNESTILSGQFVGRAAKPGALFDGVTFTASYSPVVFYGPANPTFRNCVFRDSYASGAYVTGEASPRFENCIFRGNREGGVQISSGSVTIVGSTFQGGGRALSITGGSALVSDSYFINNPNSNRLISLGGGQVTLDRCTVLGNSGEELLSVFGGQLTLRNTVVANNTSNYGGVLHVYSGRGGILEILQSTIAYNQAINGTGAIHNTGDSLVVHNAILWGNRGRYTRNPPITVEEQQIFNQGTKTISHSIIEGFSTLGGTNNRSDTPLFTDAGLNDFSLSSISPAINAGDASLDQSTFTLDRSGHTRVLGSAPDLGAYEFTGTPDTPLRIVRSPGTLEVELNGTATFVAESADAGTFTWQIETSPGVWTTLTSGGDYTITVNGNTSTLAVAHAAMALDGTRFRYLFGSIASSPFRLSVVDQRIIYVDPYAVGTPNGTTWANAFRNLQDALTNWSTGAEIWVARKTKLELTQPLVLEEGMRIYGGFAGTESSLSQRLAGSQTQLENPFNSSTLGYFLDQSSRPLTRATIFDGFNCISKRTQIGIVLVNASPTIRNCTFSGFNREVLSIAASSPLIENCTFNDNIDTVILESGSSSEIARCTFNSSRVSSSPPGVLRIVSNLAGQPTQVRDTLFRDSNHTAVHLVSGASATFERCTWTENGAYLAPVLNVSSGATAVIAHSLIAGNRGLFLHDNNNSSLIQNAGSLSFLHTTVAGNTVASSSSSNPLLRQGSMVQNRGSLTVTNSIFAENTVTGTTTGLTAEEKQIYRDSADLPVVTYSLIEGLSAYTGNGNIGFSPLFDPSYPGEYRLTRYSPAVNAGSNLAASLPATDLAGQNRLVGSAVDLGARELTETIGVSALRVQIDANNANIVPVWSTADGKLVITADVNVTSAIYWEIQIDDQWVAVSADPSLSSTYNLTSATLTIAAPSSDAIPDRLVRFGIRGTAYVSPIYTVTTSRNHVRYVSTFAAAGGDGLNWDTAFNNLADAIAAAPSHTEIWVAGGTYSETATIALPAGIRIYGGFNGYGRELYLSERNPARNPVRIAHAFSITNVNGSDTPIFDGVQLLAGINLHHRGAIFRNVRFEGGAALSASSYAPHLLLEDCQFINKHVALSGFIDHVTIRRTTFTGNEVAIANANGLAWTIEDSRFENSVDRTGSFSAHFITSTVPELTVRRTTFANANSRTSALSFTEPGGSTVHATFFDCVFSNNKNTFNGAGVIDASGLSLTLERCTFLNNAAQGGSFANASVLRAHGVDLTVRNSYFANNATNAGVFSGGESYGAFYLIDSTSRFTGVTVVNNTAPSQNTGGLFVSGGQLDMANSILFGNNAASGTIESRQLTSSRSAVVNATHTLIEGLSDYAGTGNIGYNPRFVSINDRLVPGPESPARNAGDNSTLADSETDLFGNARTHEDIVDLGAIESTTTTLAPVYDLALARRVAGGYLEITFDNSRNYAGLVWQINTGSGWQTLTLPSGADFTEGNLRVLRLPWLPGSYEGAQIRLVGSNYTSTAFVATYGAAPAGFGSVTAASPSSGGVASSTRPAIAFTYDQAVTPGDFSPTTFVVHGSAHGRLHSSARWGSLTSDLLQPTLTPGLSFNAGEIVEVTSTRDIFSALGTAFYSHVARFSIPWTSRAGHFRQSDVLATTGRVTGAAAGDINGDGRGDVMFVGDDGAWIYLGDGAGGFSRFQYGATGAWDAFTLADFNGDGLVDFAGSRSGASLTVETLDVANASTTTLLAEPLAFAGSRLLPGDFDGDGHQDILVLGPSATDGEVLLLNNADNTFSPAGSQRFAPADDRTREAAVADFNHDGKLDFVQVRASTGDIVVWLNNGSGVFTADNSVRVPGTQTIAVTDLDRDGWADLIVAGGSATDTIHVYRNDRSGHLVHQRSFAAGPVVQLAAADFDGDADIDLLAITGTSADTLWTNNGSGAFTATALDWTSYNATAAAQIAVADLNADGAADVAIPQSSRITFWTPAHFFRGFTKTLLEATSVTLDEADFTSATTQNVNIPARVWPVGSYVIQTLPVHGTLRVNGLPLRVGDTLVFGTGRTYTYVPTGDYYGTDSFRIAPNDIGGRSPSAVVTLEITRVVDAPTAPAQSLRVFKNQPRKIALLATHPENETLTFTIAAQATHGFVQLDGHVATYLPSEDYAGADSFTYTASDVFGNSASATVTVEVVDTTLTVTNTNASGAGSLSAAIAALAPQGGGRIVFTPSLANQTILFSTATDTVHGPTALLVPHFLELDATGVDGLTLARNPATAELRLFRVTSEGTLILRNLTVADGLIRNESVNLPARGAAIYNEGTVLLDGVTVRNHHAHGSASSGAEGGAIYSAHGKLETENDTLFTDNRAEDDNAHGSGGAVFVRNGSAAFTDTTFTDNVAPTTGPAVHLLGDENAVIADWTRVAFNGVSFSRLGTGTVAIRDHNPPSFALPTSGPTVTRISEASQLRDRTDFTATLGSANSELTATDGAYRLYGGTAPIGLEVLPGSDDTRTVRFSPPAAGNDGHVYGGYATILLTVTEDGISYTNESEIIFLADTYRTPEVVDQDIYVVDGAPTDFSISATHITRPVSLEIISGPAHGTLSPEFTPEGRNYTYTPDANYVGEDYLIYRANTTQNLPVSARITFRNITTSRVVTTTASEGVGSLAHLLAHMPAGSTLWQIQFSPDLAGQTITLPSTPIETAAGPSAIHVNHRLVIDGSAAPGLRIERPVSAPAMRLIAVAPGAELSLINLTLAHGLAAGSTGQPGRGGAIHVGAGAFVLLDGVTFEDNAALGGTGSDGQGGALYNDGGDIAFYGAPSLLVGNSALGGSGGTGRGGAIYARNGTIGFYSGYNEPFTTFVDNVADLDDNLALVADGAELLADFDFTDVDQVGTSAFNGGVVEIDAGYGSLITGPSLLSVAPIDELALFAPTTRDVPLPLAGGVPTFIESSSPELFSIEGTLAAPILRISSETFPNPHNTTVTFGTASYRFKRLYTTPFLDYQTPFANQNQTINVTMNQPASFTLDAAFNPNLTASYQLLGELTRIESGQPVAGDTGTLTGTAPEFTLTPPSQFTGTIQFAYEIIDSANNSAIGIVRFHIANGLPTAEAGFAEAQNSPLEGALATTSVFADGGHTTGDTITYALVSQPQHGSVTQAGNTNEFIYTAAPGYLTDENSEDETYFGYDVFTFKTIDSIGQESEPTEFWIYVADLANFHPPVVTGLPEAPGTLLPDRTNMGDPNLIFSNITITDADSTQLTVRIVAYDHGYVSPNETAADWTYDWNPVFGDHWITTGTPEEVTTRVRDLSAYSYLPDAPHGTVEESFVPLVVIDDRAGTMAEIPFRGFVSYNMPQGVGASQSLPLSPQTPYSSWFFVAQRQGQPVEVAFLEAELLTPNGSGGYTRTFIEDLSAYGTLSGPGASLLTVTPPPDNGLSQINYTFTPGPDFPAGGVGIELTWSLRTELTDFDYNYVWTHFFINTPPLPGDDTVSRGANALTISVATLLANDSDAELGDVVNFDALVSATSANGVALSYSDGVITYAASPLTIDDSFVYRVKDSRGATATATVHVLWQNNPPVAADDSVERIYGQPLILTAGMLLANDSDPENDTLGVSAVSASSTEGGTVSLTDGVITYTPTSESTLGDSFTYTITDARGATDSATVTITIANRAPVAADRTLTRYNDQPAQIATAELLALAADPEGDAVQIVQVDEYSILGGDIAHDTSAITYTTQSPALVKDEDFFTYEIADSHGATSIGFITVQLLNRAPVATNDSVHRFNDANATLSFAALLANDSDADGDALTVEGVASTSAQGGTISVVGDTVTYTPPTTPFNASDSFIYTIADAHNETATATVTIIVDNRTPTPADDVIDRFNTEPAVLTLASLLANDTDPDADTLIFVSADVTSEQGATITIVDGTLTYTAPSYDAITGDDTFTYKVKDALNAEATATVTIRLVNRAPIPGTLVVERFNDQPATLAVATLLAAASDPDLDEISFVALAANSAQGADVSVASGTITYTAASPAAITGDDTFTYTITDHRVETAVTGIVTVKLLNRAPTVAPVTIDRHNTDALTTVPIATLLAAASDADGHEISFVSVPATSTGGGILAVVGSNVLYTPASLPRNDDDTFAFTVRDEFDETATGTATLRVANRAPVASNDTIVRTAGENATVATAVLLANDSDPDGDELTLVSVSATSAQGATVSLSDGVITYSLNGVIAGNDTFTYTIHDTDNETATATVTVEIDSPASPVLTIEPRSAGGVTLQLTGTRYTLYTILVSTDLLTWTELTNNVATDSGGHATIEDTTSPDEGSARFYRAESN